MADVLLQDIGRLVTHAPGHAIARTLHDGLPRTFLEQSVDHPYGLKQLVLPFQMGRDAPIVCSRTWVRR